MNPKTCDECGAVLVLHDALVGTPPDESWNDEYECPACRDGIYLDDSRGLDDTRTDGHATKGANMNRKNRRANEATNKKAKPNGGGKQYRATITRAHFEQLMQRAGQAVARNAALQFEDTSPLIATGAPTSDPSRVTRAELIQACGASAAIMVGVVLDLLGVHVVDEPAPAPTPEGGEVPT